MNLLNAGGQQIGSSHQEKAQQYVQVTIKNINQSIQDLTLQAPKHWTFGQMLYVIHYNHSQLQNYKFQGLKLMHAGSYVEEEEKLEKYLKPLQNQITLFLKVDVNVTEQVQKIQEQKLKLDSTYALNLLWDSYVEKISPFAQDPAYTVQEKTIQQSQLELEIMSSVFPLLHPQHEKTISEIPSDNNQPQNNAAQRAQNQVNQQEQEIGEDHFFARNIPIIISIYYFVIYKFEGPMYYMLTAILLIYYFIKYQDNKHKINEARQRQAAAQLRQQQQNQQANDNVAQNNGENNNNNVENQNGKQENQANGQVPGEEGEKKETKTEANQNQNGENQPIQDTQNQKEINITENNNGDANQQNNQAQQTVNTNTQQGNKANENKKVKATGIVLFILRIKEFVYCFVMSLFPLWYVELYNRNHPKLEKEEENTAAAAADANQQQDQEPKPEGDNNNNQKNDDVFNQIKQNYTQETNNQQNQTQNPIGFLEKIDNYLEDTIKHLQKEEELLRNNLNNLAQGKKEEQIEMEKLNQETTHEKKQEDENQSQIEDATQKSELEKKND